MGLLRGVARTAVVAGTATAVSGRVNRRQQRRFAAKDAQEAAPEEAPQEAEQPAADSMTDELEQLADLRNQGILTEDEFAAKKKQVLGI
jgi:hypothetical protein